MSDGGLTIAVEWERTLDDLLERTSKFPKTMRYVLGARIDEAGIDVAVLLVDARFTKGERRRKALEEMNLRLNRLRVLVRLAHQRKCLDHGGFEHVVRALDAFGRGLGAWLRQASGAAA
jgi:hypothetical protein